MTKLRWHRGQSKSLILVKGKIHLAGWYPYKHPVGSSTPHLGFVKQETLRKVALKAPNGSAKQMYEAEARFYKTWRGWKNAVWREYRVKPPANYTI